MKNNSATTTKTAIMPVTAPALKMPAMASQPVSVVARANRNTNKERREAFMAIRREEMKKIAAALYTIGYSLILA
jgi:hypothetical protein